MSQIVIALHFVYVGWRSRNGRCWNYAPLRFVLDRIGTSLLSLPQLADSLKETHVTSPALKPMSEAESLPGGVRRGGAAKSIRNYLSRVLQRLHRIQHRLLSKCRVFIIPCKSVDISGENNGYKAALARPAFNMGFLRLLHDIAEAHIEYYCGFVFLFLFLPCCASALVLSHQGRDIPVLLMALVITVAFLGFVSSARYNLDRIAVTQTVLSFRFAIFAVLLSQWTALMARRAYLSFHQGSASLYDNTFWSVATVAVTAILCSICLLLDCSPQLPATVQIVLTVRMHCLAPRQLHLRYDSYRQDGAQCSDSGAHKRSNACT